MEDDKMMSFFRFEDLRIYDKSLAYVEWVYRTTQLFPVAAGNECFAADFLSSARKVAVAIAEGSARTKPQFAMMLKDARAGVRECLVHATIAVRLQLMSEEQGHENREMLMEMSRMLGALISSLEKPAKRHEVRNAEYDERI
jgi:four helix bundle protein